MDPITAVGAVASIITLAQTALSLSKALYTLGSAVQSASEDIEALADDLRTFARSLSLLSRLLEDSKSWYSDDVYLLTAKIIRDCAELYEKIDKILVKLGSNGKNSWKVRMKFVYKEGEIRRLMKRLRDMKGTLATVLMSLQVDLQLSLLNISSSSKIQRSPEKELDSETIRHLKAAQYAVESCNVLPKYSESSESKSIINDAKIHQTEIDKQPHPIKLLARTTNTRSFVALSGKQPSSDTVPNLVCKSTTGPVFAKLNPAGKKKEEESEVRSLKSVSSTESFKSAVSVQKEVLDLAQEVKAVKGVLHAFRTALDTLETLITRRISENNTCYPGALQLKTLLLDGQKYVEETHVGHCQKHGIHYVQKCKEKNSAILHDISIQLMRGVVTSLHMLSAEHEVITTRKLNGLHKVCEDCLRETLEALEEVANLASRQELETEPSWSMPMKFCGATSVTEPGSYDLYISGSRRQQVPQQNLPLTKPPESSWAMFRIGSKGSCQTGFSNPENQDARPAITVFNAPSRSDTQLTTESLKKKVKPPGQVGSSRSTRSSISRDESYFRNFQPATTRTTSSDSGDSDEDIKIKVTGNARLMVGGAQIDYDDGGEIEIKSHNVDRTSSGRPSDCGLPSRDSVFSSNISVLSGVETPAVEQPGSEVFEQSYSIPEVLGPASSRTSSGTNESVKAIRDSSIFHPANRQKSMSHDTMSYLTLSRPPDRERRSKRASYSTMDQNPGSAFENSTYKLNYPAGEDLKVEDDSIGAPKKKEQQKMSLGAFLTDEKMGSWADEMEDMPVSGTYGGFDNAFGGSSSRPLESSFPHSSTPYTFGAYPRTNYHANASGFARSPNELPPSYSDYEYSDDDVEAEAGLNALRVAQEQDSSERLPNSPAYSPTSPGLNPATPCNSPKLFEEGGNNSTSVNFPEHPQHPLSFGAPPQDNKQPEPEESSDFWYSAFESIRNSKEMGYIVLSSQLETLGVETLPHPQIANELSKLVRDMPTVLNYHAQFADILAIRDSIITILKTIDQQLGFELALIGWSCVWKLLSNHEDLLTSEQKEPASTLKTTYTQLLEITGIMARYAVMENLYRNSPTMTLKPEYQSSLQHLCLSMLSYFSSAFELRRSQLTEVKINGGMNEIVFSADHKSGLEKQLQFDCESLMGDVRKADDLCRGFRVVVDVKEEDESDSEMSGEDESDGSWE